MKEALTVIQIIASVSLSALILLQAKGTGLGRAFGSSTYHSKRGVEVLVFRMTIFLSIAFVVVSLVNQVLI